MRFNYKVGHIENGVATLIFDSNSKAIKFAKALYQWNIRNFNDRTTRSPLKRNDSYVFLVTEQELALINTYNNMEKAPPEEQFTVFDPLINSAAEAVRLQFMSKPYKGATNPLLDKKDYDDWETVSFYSPPYPSQSDDGILYYRTEIESNANEAVALLAREKKGKWNIQTRYEIKTQEQQLQFEPAAGYELFTLSVDDIASASLDSNPIIQQWKRECRKDINVDARFIAIECKGKYYLYGQDMKDNQYKIIELGKGENTLQNALKDEHPGKKIQLVDFDKEIIKDVIKYGKCFGSHPASPQIPLDTIDGAFDEIQNAINEVIAQVNTTKEFPIIIQEPHQSIFVESPEDATRFTQMVHSKLTPQVKSLYGIKACKEFVIPLNKSEMELLDQRLPSEYVVRPNHGFAHSVRVAAYVPVLVQHYQKYHPEKCKDMDEQDIRLLQLAMLYSVVGRETEIGFGSDAKREAKLGQIDDYIEKQKNKLKLIMQDTPIDDARKNKAIGKIKALGEKRSQEEEKFNAESTEYTRYREKSALAFLDFCEKSGFSEKYLTTKGTHKILENLSADSAGNIVSALNELNLPQGVTKKIMPDGTYSLKIPMMHYHALLLYKMSDPGFNFNDGFGEIISKAHGLDLMRCYNKIPSHPESFSAGNTVTGLTFDDSKECQQSAINTVKFALDSLVATGNRITVGVNNEGELFDQQIPEDWSKYLPSSSDTQSCIENLSTLSPLLDDLTNHLGFASSQMKNNTNPQNIADKLPIIQSCSKNAEDNNINLEFATPRDAALFIELMIQHHILPQEIIENYDPTQTSVVVSRIAFNEMQGIIKYKLVEVPKIHNEENNLINEMGEITALKLIQDGNALGRNIGIDKSQINIDFNVDQLNDPVNVRPVTRFHVGHEPERIALDRHTLMDMSEKTLTNTIKDFEFVIEPNLIQEDDETAFQQNINIELEKSHKKLFIYQLRTNSGETLWCCYGKDANGRIKTVDMGFDGDIGKLNLEKGELLRRMVVHFGYYKKLTRGLHDYRDLEHQIPIDEKGMTLKSAKEDYLMDDETAYPVSRFSDLGKPKNTIFTPKLSTTLMRPDGTTRVFSPADWTDFIPVGTLYDANQVHLRGERFIWKTDAYTNDRFWLGTTAENKLKREFRWGENISLDELKQHLAQPKPDVDEWNEVMVGLTKTALKGLFVQDNYPIYRIAMIYLYQNIKTKGNIDVPLMIMDGENKPTFYLESQLKEDLKNLFIAEETNDYSQLLNYNKQGTVQREIIEIMLESIDYQNLKSLHSDIDERVNAALDKINLIGSLKREQEYTLNNGKNTVRDAALAKLEQERINKFSQLQKEQHLFIQNLSMQLTKEHFNPHLHDNLAIKTFIQEDNENAIMNLLNHPNFVLDANIIQLISAANNPDINNHLSNKIDSLEQGQLDYLLDKAVEFGHFAVVNILLDKGAKPTIENLIFALRFNRPDIAKQLVSDRTLLLRENLTRAIDDKNTLLFDFLIQQGVIPDYDNLLAALNSKNHEMAKDILNNTLLSEQDIVDEAINKGNFEVIDFMLSLKFYVDYNQIKKAIQLGIRHNKFQIADLLINHSDELLLDAITNRDVEIVEFLIQNHIKFVYEDLSLAIDQGNDEIIELFLKHKNIENIDLLSEAIKNEDEKVIKYLINNNIINVSIGDIKNAVKQGSTDIAEMLLLESNLNNIQTLKNAIHNNDLEMANILIDIDGSLVDDLWQEAMLKDDPQWGDFALKANYKSNNYDFADAYEKRKPHIFELLLQSTTKLDYRILSQIDNLGSSKELDQILLNHSEMINDTMLTQAIENRNFQIIDYLYNALDRIDINGNGVLHRMLIEKPPYLEDCLKALIDKNANMLNHSNNANMTPIMIAALICKDASLVKIISKKMRLQADEQESYLSFIKNPPTTPLHNLRGFNPKYQVPTTKSGARPAAMTVQKQPNTERLKKLCMGNLKLNKFDKAIEYFISYSKHANSNELLNQMIDILSSKNSEQIQDFMIKAESVGIELSAVHKEKLSSTESHKIPKYQ